ncbi:hypothetical protein Maes01_00967 [Microbulbifer aestuariivivens]|uniref:Squalene cyclase C-terminal domain-containing protein n=1 Tax=Microbulbifer aestuariivivens TaxID=1908308 RepID=A0ABP9WQC0_9GAMM
MFAKDQDLARRVSRCISESARALGAPPTTGWLAKLLENTYFESFSPLSGTELGVLVSLDSESPERLRIATQPGSKCCRDTLSNILTQAGTAGVEANEQLKILGDGSGHIRDKWQISLGSAFGKDQPEFRLYVGTTEEGASGELPSALRQAGIWGPKLTDSSAELVERVKSFSTLIGVSKRLGRQTSYLLYFSSNIPLSYDLIEYICEPLGKSAANQAKDYCATHTKISAPAKSFGWGVAIGGSGELLYLKLELTPEALSQNQKTDYQQPLKGTIDDLRKKAMSAGLEMQDHSLSIRLTDKKTSITHYFSYTSGMTSHRIGSTFCRSRFTTSRNSFNNTDKLTKTVQTALSAVLEQQNSDGSWSDFEVDGIGKADDWVTAHIAYRLSQLPKNWNNNHITTATNKACDYLLEKNRPGWGYNDQSPVDADSTAHAILLIETVKGEIDPEILSKLLEFQNSDGGFSTFQRTDDIPSLHSWCNSHPDVTPLAIQALAPSVTNHAVKPAIAMALQRVELDRLQDGNWPAFWWDLRWYTAAAWARTSKTLNTPPPDFSWSRTKISSGYECRSALDAAYLLELSTAHRRQDIASLATEFLLDNQLANGLWPTVPALRVTLPEIDEPWNTPNSGALYSEISGVYSSATILSAIVHSAPELEPE